MASAALWGGDDDHQVGCRLMRIKFSADCARMAIRGLLEMGGFGWRGIWLVGWESVRRVNAGGRDKDGTRSAGGAGFGDSPMDGIGALGDGAGGRIECSVQRPLRAYSVRSTFNIELMRRLNLRLATVQIDTSI